MSKSVSLQRIANFDGLSDDALIRCAELIASRAVPFSLSTMWREVKRGKFPQPVKVSSNITAFRLGHVRKWQENPTEFSASKLSNKAQFGDGGELKRKASKAVAKSQKSSAVGG